MNADFSGLDFSGVRLMGVIHNSNLTEATFDKTTDLEGAIFSHITEFNRSNWTGANWWDANLISCDLARYLWESYRAAEPGKLQKATNLVANCS